ncbi:2OG-Fe(II) oxygenase [Alteromonas ponticola]|uniref:2OG-Fe(II) oxygenase n=1 Tax=Alteromonas aquimaris TaxID=2998417 RepID=A0ABT3P8E9_9ALTE|nr:2OG-Fe(II) oxygenase [Alteromonas aquimaris]MCW8109010.1 2OG-Fe(II) oxygenase [Alteromonas aquimaris]
MNGEAFFQQALQHFSRQNIPAANQALTQAAQFGHSMATLYLAEQYFRQRPDDAYQFLQQRWNAGVKGTLHRLVTLKAFFDEPDLTVADFKLLHSEAIAGHAESILILLNLSDGHKDQVFYAALLQRFAPRLLHDLALHDLTNQVKEYAEQNADIDDLLEYVCRSWFARTHHEPVLTVEKIGIKLYRKVISQLCCNYITLRLQPHLQPSMVHDPVTGKGIKNDIRTSDIVPITPDHLDWFCLEIDMILESLTGISRKRGESMNLLRYKNHQEYKPHYDAIVGQGPEFDKILSDGGQRVKTAITYLSDNYTGGETEFPKLGIRVKGNVGDVLIFDNWTRDGATLRDSYHSGRPVTQGTKWILTKWLRESSTHYGGMVYPMK